MRLDFLQVTKPGRWIYSDVEEGNGVGGGIQALEQGCQTMLQIDYGVAGFGKALPCIAGKASSYLLFTTSASLECFVKLVLSLGSGATANG